MTRRAAPAVHAMIVLAALIASGCRSDRSPPIERRSPPPTGTAAKATAAPAERDGPTTDFQTGVDRFVFAIGGEPETLDPGRARGVNENKIISNMFEGLVEVPLGAGPVVPGVAERWDRSEDGLTYTFHLRADAKWSNGDPVTAEDFRYSWMRVLDRALAAPYADMLYVIEGARDYYEGRSDDPGTVGIEVVDTRTLKVRLDYVAPYFLELCAFYTYRPVHRATVEAKPDRWTRPENIVVNGPYILAEWSLNQRLLARQNPHYWDKASLKIREFEALPIQESTTMLTLYEGGGLDWNGSLDLPAIKISTLKRRADFHVVPYLGVYFYRYNVTHEVLADNRVRQALAMAVDRAAITDMLKMGLTPSATMVPKMGDYVSAETDVRFDPDRARALLTEAGYPEGKAFPRLRLLYNTQENHKRVAEMIQQMWTKYLGIGVDLENQEWKVYLKSQRDLAYDISRSGWIGDYLDPLTFLGMWTTGNGNNNTGWSDKEYDGLLERALREGDEAKRLALLRQAEGILLQRGPVLPIYHYARAYVLNPAVKGFEPHPLDLHPIKYIEKTR